MKLNYFFVDFKFYPVLVVFLAGKCTLIKKYSNLRGYKQADLLLKQLNDYRLQYIFIMLFID